MSLQVIGDGLETGLGWSVVRLSDEDQINGGWGNAPLLFNDNHFSAGIHSEILSNWISSMGDKNLRFNQGNWDLFAKSSLFDSSAAAYTLCKILPRPVISGIKGFLLAVFSGRVPLMYLYAHLYINCLPG